MVFLALPAIWETVSPILITVERFCHTCPFWIPATGRSALHFTLFWCGKSNTIVELRWGRSLGYLSNTRNNSIVACVPMSFNRDQYGSECLPESRECRKKKHFAIIVVTIVRFGLWVTILRSTELPHSAIQWNKQLRINKLSGKQNEGNFAITSA